MLSYKYLFDIALILISTKLLGLLTRKFQMPQVVGALLAGLILGPAMLNILNETNFIQQMAELGVIVLMFTAGLETDIQELKKTGKASLIIALMGVLFPLLGGFVIASIFNKGDGISTNAMMQNIFIGIILTATSVSITVETLKELGKLSTRAGNAILGAALIDDILGIIGVTIITSLADPSQSVNIWLVLAKIILFFICSLGIGFIFYKFFAKWVKRYDKDLRRFIIVAFVFCLLLAFAAEEFFGVADITGAFIAGLIISNTERTKYIEARFNTMSYILLSPIFFASIGISIEMPKMSGNIIWFTILLLIAAILTKVIGCGIGAKLCKYSNKESLRIGVGMVSRGEVALIIASKGAAVGLMSAAMFGPVVVMVVVTAIITPILLKIVFRKNNNHPGSHEEVNSELVKRYGQNFEFSS
ncbi:cation:proton antiporter [Cellulosilyticum sp. I15G10I2]|uniref:cation:proton antiporter n=1 Tax=Cellulosilyticum sp. I15G10I2 TaxID=1892843 RepID=UPI00085C2184|nr:cation:proton antiporter [Cellulosilyticum sp. I15G10I2]